MRGWVQVRPLYSPPPPITTPLPIILRYRHEMDHPFPGMVGLSRR